MKLKLWPGLIAIALALALAMPAAARVLKINESLGPGSVEEAALQRFKEIVEERSNRDLEIRIFLQDGRNDNRGMRRNGNYDPTWDWFLQNVRLKDALVEKGYDVNYSWGIGRHSQKGGGPMIPEMMRWLWRDQPVSVDVNDKVERSFREPVSKR